MTNDYQEDRQSILDELADNWSPRQMRDLASTLLRLADSLDQNWTDTHPSAEQRSIFNWPNPARRIERDGVNLAGTAKLITAQRNSRRKFLPDDLLGEPAWDMLLELFMQHVGGAKVSVTSLCLASGVPTTTALRYIHLLERHDLIERKRSAVDKRTKLVKLTENGVLAIGQYLEQH